MVLVAAAWGGLVAALVILAPALPLPPLAGYLLAFASVAASAITTATVAPTGRPVAVAIVVAAALAGLGVALAVGARAGAPIAAALVTASLLAGGSALGAAVGGRVEHPGHLLIVAAVSLLVDSFSVFHPLGPAAAATSRTEVVALVALPWPVLGTREVAPILGVGDVVFAALYLGAARRHGLGIVRTALALALGLLVTALAVLCLERAIPALPAMGAAVLLACPAARKLPAKDRRTGLVIIGALLTVGALLWLFR